MTPLLQAEGMGIEYLIQRTQERFTAIRDITMSVPEGAFFSIVGPSGCGKSTFLKAVAGLIRCTQGRLLIDGRIVSGPGDDRAVVFQSPSLLPWRDVIGNVSYGMQLRRRPAAEVQKQALAMIELVGLTNFMQRYPRELSGGMRQRVNLARALAADPKLLLLDEPFSALDAQTREVMQAELLRIWEKTRKTAIFITHDIAESVFLSDKVAIMSKGPGAVLLEVVDIDLPRPRTGHTKRDVRFFALTDYIWSRIRDERGDAEIHATTNH
jgi:NitT/TauT family transport system ATP-binding protein